MGRMLGALAATVLVADCAIGAARAAELPANDYPTAARADYVFGCMQVNGQTRDALERFACSIDVIASLLPYDQYEEAETVMRVRQRGGKYASMFLSMPMLRAKVDELKRAQVEAELRCFLPAESDAGRCNGRKRTGRDNNSDREETMQSNHGSVASRWC